MKKSYSLALELDRLFKLNLNNEQFNQLANFLDGYENSRKYFDELAVQPPTEIINILDHLKKIK